MKGQEAIFSHQTDHWATPRFLYWWLVEHCGYYDPCPLHADFDGLSIDWTSKKNVYINPPFSNISAFVDKAIKEWRSGCSFILLLPVRTDTKWFKKLSNSGCDIEFITGRLHFNESKQSAPFPCMLVKVDHMCSSMGGYHVNKFYATDLSFEREAYQQHLADIGVTLC